MFSVNVGTGWRRIYKRGFEDVDSMYYWKYDYYYCEQILGVYIQHFRVIRPEIK